MSTTEIQELRADLDRSTRALERAAETARKAEATIAELQAELVLAEQKVSTWTQAAVARAAERGAAARVEIDTLTGVLEAHLKMWRASGVAADRKAGAVEALTDVLNMVRRRRTMEKGGAE